MPTIKAAKKYVRVTTRKTSRNKTRKTELRKTIRKVVDLVKTKELAEAQNAYKNAQKALDKAVKFGIIKKNTAARKKSRLVKHLLKAKKK